MPVLILSSFVYFGFVSATENLPPPSVVQAREGVVACYWETYLHPQFSSRDIKANLCNHIVYGTAKLDKTTWQLTHDNMTIDIDLGGFRNMSEMKAQDPNLKVEIGAWSQEGGAWQTPREYFEMASNSSKRETFARSVATFVTENNFDGFHLHWGNPKSSGIDLDQAKTHLTQVLRGLKTALHLANKTLSVAVWSPLASKIDKKFEIENVYKEADLVFVNAFHYFGNWFPRTGGFAPLYPGKGNEVPDEQYLNVDYSWQHMKERGAVPCKTVLVISPKGSGFKLKNSTENTIGALSVENAVPSIGEEPKFREICKILQQPSGKWVQVFDKDRKVPYMHNGDEWVSFEDEESVEAKVKYANKEGLAGLAINNLAYDDFEGRCNSGNKYPLLKIVEEKLRPKLASCGGSGATKLSLHSFLAVISTLAILINSKF